MRGLIRDAFRLIAQWWEMIKERDECVVHDRFVASVAREMDALHWRRGVLIEEITAIAYCDAMGSPVCRSAHSWQLRTAQRKLQGIDGRLEGLEHQIGIHALLCDRSSDGRTQRGLALH